MGKLSEKTLKEEQYWRDRGINSVPAFVINQDHLISGAQKPAILADALLNIASEETV